MLRVCVGFVVKKQCPHRKAECSMQSGFFHAPLCRFQIRPDRIMLDCNALDMCVWPVRFKGKAKWLWRAITHMHAIVCACDVCNTKQCAPGNSTMHTPSGFYQRTPICFHIRSDGITLESIAQGACFGHVRYRPTITAGYTARSHTVIQRRAHIVCYRKFLPTKQCFTTSTFRLLSSCSHPNACGTC